MADENEGSRRTFSKISSDCVLQAAQSLGIQTSAEVSSALVDDVSFRVRHITDTACQFMHHSKRKQLTTDDFDKALKWSRVEPLHGHQTGQPATFSPTQNSSVFIMADHQLDLSSTIFAPPLSIDSLPRTPHMEASWVAIEGVPVNKNNQQEQSYVKLNREGNEPNERYLSVLMEALTGDKEDLRIVALTDLLKNPSIANILPDLAIYLQETLGDWLQFTPRQLTHLLKLCLALFQNPHLFLEPYLPVLCPGLKSIVLDPSYTVCSEECEHWSVRDLAAAAVAALLHKCTLQNESLSDLHLSLHTLLGSSDPSLVSLHGAILTLCYLQGDSLMTVLYPHLEELVKALECKLESRVTTERREEILRVQEALLLAAKLLLTSGYKLEEPQSTQTPPPPPDPKPTHLSPPKDTEGLFANTSFGLSSEPTDMEIDQHITHTESTQHTMKDKQKTPSMYEHLMELFGESLLLRLSCCPQFESPSTTFDSQIPSVPDLNHKRNTQTSPALLALLSEEGFKSIKVELPLSALPRPPRRNTWNLVIPKTKLPVSGNVLEQKSREAKHRSNHAQERRPALSSTVNKGVCASYRRHGSRSRLDSVDVQSAWL